MQALAIPIILPPTLRPINYKQNDMKVGVEYDQPTDQKSIVSGSVCLIIFRPLRMGRQTLWAGRAAGRLTTAFVSLPPSNMANYITGEGALDLKSYKTRLTGSLTYGWLSQNDYVFDSTTAAATATPRTLAGRFDGHAGLGATTFTADIAGVTRPIAPLTLRYSYNAYNYENNNTANQVLTTAFSGTTQQPLLPTGAVFVFPAGCQPRRRL